MASVVGSVVSISALRKSYREGGADREVLRGLDLEVACGELVCILGRSGFGKTTLLNIVGGLDTDYVGEVSVAGLRLGELADAELSRFRNRTVGFVFQDFALMRGLPCVENVMLPAAFSGRRGDPRVLRERALELVGEVGLADRASASPSQLSGGEKQRLCLARALFNRPAVLLCDELTGNLDRETGSEIVGLLRELHQRGETTIVAVAHDDVVAEMADRVLRLEGGRLQ